MNGTVGEFLRQMNVERTDGAGIVLGGSHVGPRGSLHSRDRNPVDKNLSGCGHLASGNPARKPQASEPAYAAWSGKLGLFSGRLSEHNGRAYGRRKVCQTRFDDMAILYNRVIKRAGKAVTAVADMLLDKFMNIFVRPNDLDRIAIDEDFDGKLSDWVVCINHKAGKLPLGGAVKRSLQAETRRSAR